MKVLYSGFDLCDPSTSVSMTINGPAPTILAMFFNTAIDQQVEKFGRTRPRADRGDCSEIKAKTLAAVRGTVQADILKEDQGQNTCIFSTEFSLKVMGDIQEYFIEHEVRNFYSVSISGYHIAEAGANPISQLAFTLANGFTFVEAYLARGMKIDDFAPNLSFFFSYGMDPEYAVLGRVARRIWAVAMRDRYGANERSQKLKFHSQTSGPLAARAGDRVQRHPHHAAGADLDLRQHQLAAHQRLRRGDHHADRGVGAPRDGDPAHHQQGMGPGEEREPEPGLRSSIDELTDLVEEAVLKEFEAISERGGVLGAMETGYQRGKIQEESLYYEHKKHDGSYPIVGVNTFRNPHGDAIPQKLELIRSTEDEKQSQLKRLREFQQKNASEVRAKCSQRLREAVIKDENVFAVLMDAVRVCSLGQITHALFEVGGQYRRSM